MESKQGVRIRRDLQEIPFEAIALVLEAEA
jgi:hypothetical protein